MSQNKLVSNSTLVWICYALYAAAVFNGITAIIAIIVNYMMRKDMNDSLTKNHVEWQISTFWRLVIGVCIVGVMSFLIKLTYILAFLAIPLWFVLGIWYVYRTLKGIIAFNNGRLI